MTSRREARQLLAHTVEPGDHRLHSLLQVHAPEDIWSMVERYESDIPDGWLLSATGAQTALQRSLERADVEGIRWIDPEDPAWPTKLSVFDSPDYVGESGSPIGLWVQGGGDPAALFSGKTLAIVGARGCTAYGAERANDLAADSTLAGYTIISGGAFGIDAAAHRGALAAQGATVAVMPCGVDVDYPRAHASLLNQIADTGLVVSEYEPGCPPARHRFLNRNRIIAGLSDATVVVEAATRSGSMKTLDWANGIGRPAFAVPGPASSAVSAGPHTAIRTGRAALATSANDVFGDLHRGRGGVGL